MDPSWTPIKKGVRKNIKTEKDVVKKKISPKKRAANPNKNVKKEKDVVKKEKITPKKRAAKPNKNMKSEIKHEDEFDEGSYETDVKTEVDPQKTLKRKFEDEGPSSAKKTKTMSNTSVSWHIENVVADLVDINVGTALRVITLLNEGNTIPFIARYRKDMTNHMEVQKLNEVADTYENLRTIQEKVSTVIKKIEQQDKMNPILLSALRASKTAEEIEFLYYPYKPGSKKTLAETARNSGLEPLATNLINGLDCHFLNYVQETKIGITNVNDVKLGVKHILADIISKNHQILDELKNAIKIYCIVIESQPKTIKKQKDSKETFGGPQKKDQSYKFETYYNFTCPIKTIQPYQVLALNRGETLKVLSIKIKFPTPFKCLFERLCQTYVFNKVSNCVDTEKLDLIKNSIDDAYKRLVEPLLCRNLRSEMTKNAEKASVDVFVTNLRQLLLTSPVRGKIVLGIDPGFRNGCKIGVISSTGDILHTDIMYLPMNNREAEAQRCRNIIRNIVSRFGCEVIAIGNGTACRETEELISDMISCNEFGTELLYCIVNESGASIYSITPEAAAEMPNLDVNLRSAVSIARRLQDPLAEYVKVDPKHLGVGMYQHDLTESTLKKALDSVVVECVSFVGVDLNTGSEALLRKVAGLNVARAKNIIKWRSENGPFINREQLRLIKTLGPKSFEQCAGFIRVLPLTSRPTDNHLNIPAKKKKTDKISTTPNILDATCIHPESYEVALKFLSMMNEKPSNIGTSFFIERVKHYIQGKGNQSIANDLDIGVSALEIIIKGFTQPLNYDFRTEFSQPLFRKGIVSIEELKIGTILTGRVHNVVDFGAFVDVGVGINGLIHKSKMRNTTLQLGDKVEVSVLTVDVQRKRIGLGLIKLLT